MQIVFRICSRLHPKILFYTAADKRRISMESELDQKIAEWLKWDRNEVTKTALKKLVDENKRDELSKILLKRLTFGTAGLRGKMDVGYARMNDLVIVQTAQGFLRYLEDHEKELLAQNGIVVGYDGRHNSKRWAEITATVFVNANYPVKLFGDVVPTPFVPFSVSKFKCASGVMVTASHNPKEDNGYKVYCKRSTQIVSPADKDIQRSILNNQEPWDSSWDTSILKSTKLLQDPLDEVFQDYLNVIHEAILPEQIECNKKAGVLITYTPMHGVGYRYIEGVFCMIGIRFVPVAEQKDPDPEFSTVKFPNPEEGKSSLDLSFKTADENGSRVIIANDPDADRMGAAEKDSNDQWRIFSGNELGALFGWWLLHCYKLKHPGEPLSQVYMLSSTVSSMILKTMSKKEGFNFVDTLTGFKWLGNKALDLEQEGKKVIFCFEEAIGYMCSIKVPDKDGVTAAFQFATMVSYLYSNNKTLAMQLDEIYSTYGHHVSNNSYYICHEPETIKRIFEKIRNFNGQNTYPIEILNGKYKITSVRDLTTGYDDNQPDKKAVLPVDPNSQMITFNFSNGLVCTLRTSGTEPKVKYYSELCADPDITDKKMIVEALDEQIAAICEEMLQPKQNNLIERSG